MSDPVERDAGVPAFVEQYEDRLLRERDDYRAAYNRVATAARTITAELQKVGDETQWQDGDETDRVYAWREMRQLVDALDAARAKFEHKDGCPEGENNATS